MAIPIRPHCPRCFAVIKQLAVWRSDDAPGIWLIYCPECGCTLGAMSPFPLPENSTVFTEEKNA